MVRAVLAGVAAVVMSIAMPALLLYPIEPETEKQMLLVIEQPVLEEAEVEQIVRVTSSGILSELPLEEYLVGVVLSEVPMSFEQEALKAQAVAARTFAMRQIAGGKHEDYDLCGDSRCCQAWTSKEVLRDKLGSSWESYWERAAKAVQDTEHEVLTYDGELIDAVYFSCSGGRTEDAVAVWGAEVPYLQSVESPGEEAASPYRTTSAVSYEKFSHVILQSQPEADLSGKPEAWIGAVSRTEGGGVETIQIGGIPFSGTVVRGLFGLRSTNFSVNVSDEQFVFEVFGYGHRVGMSQYGANAMALQGKTYQEILKHYYSGAEVE